MNEARRVLRAAVRRPTSLLARAAGVYRLGAFLVGIAGVVAAIAVNLWWLALLIVVTAIGAWGWASAILGARDLASVGVPVLDLEPEICAPYHPVGDVRELAHVDRVTSFLFIIRNHSGRICRLQATLVSRSVEGLEHEYPQGDMALRWQVPEGREHRFLDGATWRVDVAYFAEPHGRLTFLGPDERKWGWLKVVHEEGLVTCLVDIEDLDTGLAERFRCVLTTTAHAHPQSMAVEKVDRLK